MNDWTLADSLRVYDAEDHTAELNRFRNMPSLADAIRTAADSTDEDGVPYPHQGKNWNFWPDAIPKATDILTQAERQFQACEDFEQIHRLVKKLVRTGPGRITGLGKLYCYDVAFRIGAFRGDGYLPRRVHLHAGTRKGAKRLGLPWKRDYLEMSELPEALRQRPAWEVENILCHHAKFCKRRDRQTA
jgi:hypothetical protein